MSHHSVTRASSRSPSPLRRRRRGDGELCLTRSLAHRVTVTLNPTSAPGASTLSVASVTASEHAAEVEVRGRAASRSVQVGVTTVVDDEGVRDGDRRREVDDPEVDRAAVGNVAPSRVMAMLGRRVNDGSVEHGEGVREVAVCPAGSVTVRSYSPARGPPGPRRSAPAGPHSGTASSARGPRLAANVESTRLRLRSRKLATTTTVKRSPAMARRSPRCSRRRPAPPDEAEGRPAGRDLPAPGTEQQRRREYGVEVSCSDGPRSSLPP